MQQEALQHWLPVSGIFSSPFIPPLQSARNGASISHIIACAESASLHQSDSHFFQTTLQEYYISLSEQSQPKQNTVLFFCHVYFQCH